MPDSQKQIGFRGTVEYREKLQRAALDRGLKVQVLIERALEAYLEKPSAAPAAMQVNSSDQRLLNKIATMIQSGESEKLPIIRMLLKNYEPPEPPKIPPPGEKHEAATKETAKQSTQHRRRAG